MILFTSVSTRRKELLQQVGFRENHDFVQVDAPVTFDYHQEEKVLTLDQVRQMSIEVARQKISRAVRDIKYLATRGLAPEKTVVAGADTVVYFDGRVWDRPLLIDPKLAPAELIGWAEDRAREMLSYLRGQDFCILTGLVVAQGDNLDNEQSCCVVTEARMKPFSDSDIERYIRTGEPLDKAGAFGIQERGVILFEGIKGSYSNVVGLPLVEFVDLLRRPLFEGRVQFPFDQPDPLENTPVEKSISELKVVSVGDINYDLTFNKIPEDFFSRLDPPGAQLQGVITRGLGGTAAVFASRAHSVGFQQCSVLGVIGGDALGRTIEEKLHQEGIRPLLPAAYGRETSIALVLRDEAKHDTSLTITDARQLISEADIKKAEAEIRQADVVFISGYCLIDPGRQNATLKIMDWVQETNGILVFDATVDIEKAIEFDAFTEMTRGKVDVLVAQIPTILTWLGEDGRRQTDWTFILEQIIPILHKHFPTLFLRTSSYSHEIIASPGGIWGPVELDYSRRAPQDRLGYADERTAQHLYQFMSPRILMASASPRRLALLKQIIADNKIEVLASHLEEVYQEEDPIERVKRLASEKARHVLSAPEEFSPYIEIVIGADTEIVIDGEEIGHPNSREEARQMLRRLSGQTHQAITGLALIDTRSKREVVTSVATQVKFKSLSEEEIEQYVQSDEPMGKAGAYGIQGKGSLFVEEIDGSYSNVVGLPLERLADILDREFGMPIWDIDKVSNWSVLH